MVNTKAFNHAEEAVCVDCPAGAYCDGASLNGRCKSFLDAYNAVGNGIVEKRTEKLNELKNRISLALKEGTLQQGFEIICKKLSQLEKENEQLKKICDYNCPVHKLATHNTCLTCSAVRNSPYHDLKDVSEEELQEIRNEAEKEAEM